MQNDYVYLPTSLGLDKYEVVVLIDRGGLNGFASVSREPARESSARSDR